MLLFQSCSNQEASCMINSLESIIIGEWLVSNSNDISVVDFQTDGVMVDSTGIMIEGGINGEIFENRTFEILADTALRLRISGSNGLGLVEIYSIESYDCEEIHLRRFGSVTYKLTKNF